MTEPDRRLHAYRPDLADVRLRGRVDAENFVDGRCMQVTAPVISVRKFPRSDAMQVTQALMGEELRVFEVKEGWAFVQLETDGYVGYVTATGLSPELLAPTHRVAARSAHLYAAPALKSQPAAEISMNAAVTVTGEAGNFSALHDGRNIFTAHLKPATEYHRDFVAVAEMFLHVPYYWGGKSASGLDCSGLVQVSLQACGINAPRDTDMQEQNLGAKLMTNDRGGLQRGDLIFWKGHVGVMTDAQTLLHANAHHMMTVAEPLREAATRIAAVGSAITSIKRL